MNEIPYFFALLGVCAVLLATISIWSRRRLWVKVTALAIAALFLPATYASLASLLSRPKPVQFEWRHDVKVDARVLAASVREDEHIYVWLQLAGVDEPRAYVLPWDEQLAKQLHGARKEAEARGTEVRMRRPFKRGPRDTDRMFYAAPQAALPPKQMPGPDKSVVYNRLHRR